MKSERDTSAWSRLLAFGRRGVDEVRELPRAQLDAEQRREPGYRILRQALASRPARATPLVSARDHDRRQDRLNCSQ